MTGMEVGRTNRAIRRDEILSVVLKKTESSVIVSFLNLI